MSKSISVVIISLFFVTTGVLHFVYDAELASITPLPYALEIVWFTGIIELVFAALLFIPKYRRTTGILLGVFLLAVLPANINMAVNNLPVFGEQMEPWLLWLRVALQFPFIAWILWATGFWRAEETA